MAAPARPNILLIQADQLRADVLACYGGSTVQTPVLNGLAGESTVFDRAYCVTPVCTPARAALQTGRYPHRVGMHNNIYYPGCLVHELVDTPELLSRRLLAQGYWSGFTGKWHLGFGARKPDNREWKRHVHHCPLPPAWISSGTVPSDVGYHGDDFPGHGGGGHEYPQYLDYLTARGLHLEVKHASRGAAKYGELQGPVEATVDYFLAEQTLTHLESATRSGRPFFFSLNFWGPHEPCYIPREYLNRYDPAALSPWPSFSARETNKPSIHAVKRPPGMEWSDFAVALQHYYAHITLIDDQLGRIFAWLKERGLYDETLIIFTADHGESLGIHGGLTDKSIFMYEETCRIPLLIKPAGGAARRRADAFVNTTDFYSTILDYAGCASEDFERDGCSLREWTCGGSSPDWRDQVVVSASGLAHLGFQQRMLRTGDWKYVFNCGDTDELYDLSADPHELSNLVTDPAAGVMLRSMQVRLLQWLEKHEDPLLQAFERMRVPR